ncbi:hypothetical protein JCM5353_001851 [Sporobolomyces roseus]
MKTTTSSLAILALAASSVQAQGIVDNVKTFVKLATQAIDLEGDYYVQNAKTGKYMYFERPGDTTNFVTGDDKQTVTMGSDSAYGQSGVKWQTWAGTYITGLSKCASSQWGHDQGYNIAAVSYACNVGGKKEGTDTLEVAKQFWKAIPCGNSGSDDDNSNDDSSSSSKVANVKLNAQVKLAAKPSSKSSDDSSSSSNNFVASSSSQESAPAPTATQEEDDGVWKPKQTQDVIKSDRSTWVCQHPGWWLDRHPRYISHANHPECQDDLDNYRASLKKRDGFRSHERMHKKNKRSLVEKRASSQRVCFVAVDHGLDMELKAISNNVIDTFGGYKSVALADFDDSDESQHWIVTSA